MKKTRAEQRAERRTWSPEKRQSFAITLRAMRKARQIEAETGELPSVVEIDGTAVAFRW